MLIPNLDYEVLKKSPCSQHPAFVYFYSQKVKVCWECGKRLPIYEIEIKHQRG